MKRDGIVRGLRDDLYHSGPELSSTGAKMLLDAPARYREYVDHGEEPKHSFDLGTASHTAILRAGQGIHVTDAPDRRTKAVQEAERQARREGRVPVLRKELLQVSRMRRAVLAHPTAGPLFAKGEPEVSLFWTDEAAGVRCRARIDWVGQWVDGRDLLVDVKSCREGGAAPWSLSRAAENYGQHVQAAMYLDAAVLLGLVKPDAVFLHVHVETARPHIVTVGQLTEEALEVGRAEYRRALDIFRTCSLDNAWPTYSRGVVSVDLPDYAYRKAAS